MNTFPTSLFDFDFVGDAAVTEALAAYETHRAKSQAPAEPAELCELEETATARLDELREMATAALDSGRMAAYFRILDEIERWERCEIIEPSI